MKPLKNNIVDKTYIQHLLTKKTILVQNTDGLVGQLVSIEMDTGICYIVDSNNNKSTILINEIGII